MMTILGLALSTLAVSQQLTWQTVVAAIGGAVTTWLHLPSDTVRLRDLPQEWQDTLRPPRP